MWTVLTEFKREAAVRALLARPFKDQERREGRRVSAEEESFPRSATEFVRYYAPLLRTMFPGTAGLARELTSQLRGRACEVSLRPENKPSAGVIGTAADFAVSWHYGAEPLEMTRRAVAVSDGARLGHVLLQALRELRVMHAMLLDAAELLAPPLILLAQADATFRAGCALPSLTPITKEILAQTRFLDPPVAVALGESVSPALSDEVAELLRHTAVLLGDPISAVCNPGFYGCGLLTGSDADLILDGTLYEVKVLGGAKPAIRSEHLWQLMIYAFLNQQPFNQGHPVDRIGVMELRRQWKWTTTFDELGFRLCGLEWSQCLFRLSNLIGDPESDPRSNQTAPMESAFTWQLPSLPDDRALQARTGEP